jgi:aminomethyltransferase
VTSVAPEALRRTPLHERHRAAGAKLVPFAGWDMPLQYAGIQAEHVAVRRHAGVFDVSHMGQIETRGPDAPALLQLLLSNDIRRLPEGGAQYGVICNESGGVLDDLFTYRLADCHFLTVTNAANHERDLAWFQSHSADFDVDVIDRLADYAMLAVQGPEARSVLSRLADGALPTRMHCCQRCLADVPMLVCGTGYTGEDGAELLLDPGHAPEVWDALVSAGAVPAGLGSRDTLRLEVCFHLYGNDLSEDRGPIEAGLGWCCQEQTGFIGSPSVSRVRAEGPAEKLVAFTIEGPGIARQGNPIAGGGVVTSGSFSPCLQRGIGLAYVAPESSEPGTRLEIDVRGTTRTAIVQRKPIYSKEP